MPKRILTGLQRSKDDNTDDALFYSQPRFVHHLDYHFRQKLTQVYRELIPSNSVILDLMSSWVSHLPEEVEYQRVIGHGMNLLELQQNNRLDTFWVQNLNINTKLPLESESIDVCLMVAAWQYLEYPEDLAFELRKVIRSGGKLIVSFSNRAFWSKAPLIWKDSTDNQRIHYISSVLIAQGWTDIQTIVYNNYKERVFNFFSSNKDPFFAVIASKA